MPPERVSIQAAHEARQADKHSGAARPKLPLAPRLVPNAAPGLVWCGPDYPILSAGRYTVRGVSIQGPAFVRSYRRWSVRVEFALVSEAVSVSAFFNFGDDPAGPKVARQSRFYKAWVLANGEHPRNGQTMTPEIFLQGQFFEVEVADCNRDAEGGPKPDAEVYSRVTRIISVSWV